MDGLGGGRVRIGASETLAYPGIRDHPNTVTDYLSREHMQKKYLVTSTDDERTHLDNLIKKGKVVARVQTHARILLK
jgi:hypothetical protein